VLVATIQRAREPRAKHLSGLCRTTVSRRRHPARESHPPAQRSRSLTDGSIRLPWASRDAAAGVLQQRAIPATPERDDRGNRDDHPSRQTSLTIIGSVDRGSATAKCPSAWGPSHARTADQAESEDAIPRVPDRRAEGGSRAGTFALEIRLIALLVSNLPMVVTQADRPR
jgi:hypothetical protein